MNFTEFDRTLEDFRDSVAKANLTMRDSIARYVAMMSTIETAFVLYYDDMTAEEKAAMKTAFDKLVDGAQTFIEDESENNVHELKRDPL
jgi:hypothetical protein